MRDLMVTPVRDLPIGYERVTAPWQSAQELKAHLARAEQRMEVTIVRPLRADPYNRGQVVAIVKRHKRSRRPVPKWVLPAACVAVVVGGIGTVAYLAMKAVESVAGAVTHPSKEAVGVLLLIGLGLLLLVGRRGRIVEGTFRGVIK